MADDPYLDLIDEQWDNIVLVFQQFQDKEQIIEFDVAEQKIYSYPASDYIQVLSERTRDHTARLFAETKNASSLCCLSRTPRIDGCGPTCSTCRNSRFPGPHHQEREGNNEVPIAGFKTCCQVFHMTPLSPTRNSTSLLPTRNLPALPQSTLRPQVDWQGSHNPQDCPGSGALGFTETG